MSDVMIVTAGGRGIGAVTATLAAARGYAVAVNYLRDASAAERVVGAITQRGGRAIAVAADVSQRRASRDYLHRHPRKRRKPALGDPRLPPKSGNSITT